MVKVPQGDSAEKWCLDFGMLEHLEGLVAFREAFCLSGMRGIRIAS